MLKLTAIALTASLLVACAAPVQTPPSRLPIRSVFDAARARAALAPGSATVAGSAFMRQRGGGVVTCAGATARLVPVTTYAQERFGRLYPSFGYGEVVMRLASDSTLYFDPDPPEYAELTKTTLCDAQGRFRFVDVGPGDYFVVVPVILEVARSREGGALATRVLVKGNESFDIQLSK